MNDNSSTNNNSNKRVDPLPNFRFYVYIDDIEEVGCHEVSGLNLEFETEDYEEGGVNDYVHKLPKRIKYQNIVLKYGLAYSSKLFEWYQKVFKGEMVTRSVLIALMNEEKQAVWLWGIENAYPVKYTGTDLKATGGEVFIETVELAHTGINIMSMSQ